MRRSTECGGADRADLLRGVLVGTAVIAGCRGRCRRRRGDEPYYQWHLADVACVAERSSQPATRNE